MRRMGVSYGCPSPCATMGATRWRCGIASFEDRLHRVNPLTVSIAAPLTSSQHIPEKGRQVVPSSKSAKMYDRQRMAKRPQRVALDVRLTILAGKEASHVSGELDTVHVMSRDLLRPQSFQSQAHGTKVQTDQSFEMLRRIESKFGRGTTSFSAAILFRFS